MKLLQFPTCWPIKGLFVHWSRGWGVLSFSERLVLILIDTNSQTKASARSWPKPLRGEWYSFNYNICTWCSSRHYGLGFSCSYALSTLDIDLPNVPRTTIRIMVRVDSIVHRWIPLKKRLAIQSSCYLFVVSMNTFLNNQSICCLWFTAFTVMHAKSGNRRPGHSSGGKTITAATATISK